MTSLLQNVSDDYICLIDVNLETEIEEQFPMHGGRDLGDWAKGNYDYTHCIETYANTYVCEKDRDTFLCATRLELLKKLLQKQKDFFIEYDALIDGDVRRLQGKFAIYHEEEQEDHMLVGIRDITEMEKENIAHTVYNAGIVNFGKMEDITFDQMMEQLQEAITNKEDYDRLVSEMSREAQIAAYREGKRELLVRIRQTGDDGKTHWMETRNILMENAVGDICCISMTRCVDEEIKQTIELENAKNEAESANRAKSIFLFNMSHDIRTPMNAIMGFSAMAEKHIDDPERVIDCLKKLNISGEHLLRLINAVLDMARIESGKLEMDVQAHHIPSTIKNVECIFLADASKKNQIVEVQCDVQDEIAFYDLLRVNQIELNLISNAIKYTPEGGKITYSVRQTASKDGIATYECRVKDTGIGMSEEFCKRAFESFEKERESDVTGVEGSGLGLAIAKRLVEQMGGEIYCTSELGKGSEFVATFHLKIGTEADLQTQEPLDEEEGNLEGKRVLLVDDNALNREISCEILSEQGCIIEEAEDGEIAVEKIKQSGDVRYDLVLMDIQMPKLNGYEAARQIRDLPGEYFANLPIVAVTANAFEEDKKAALDAGMNGHVPKPIRVEELRRVLAGLVGE